METQEAIEFMLNNVLFTVIFFVCLLCYILINSLMQNDVEERKYEFGVLRTLGLRNSSLVTLIGIQTLIFAVPGIVGGFAAMKVLLQLTQFALLELAQVQVRVEVSANTVWLGVGMGLSIPFLSNIAPVTAALGTTLRSALDKMRPSLDDVEVEMVRLENKGISLT